MNVKVWPKNHSSTPIFYEHVLSITHNYDDSSVIIERCRDYPNGYGEREIIIDELPYMAFQNAEVLL